MSDPTPIDDLIADDLLLDRLSARLPAGDEPVAALLCAVAAHADRPLTARMRRRHAHSRRVFAAFAVLAVGASGAGVAAAVTLPQYVPGAAERARIERAMDANAASNRPSALLSRLGIPADADLGAERGLVLMRLADGQIVLVPAAAASSASVLTRSFAGAGSGQRADALTGTPKVAANGATGTGGVTGSGSGAGDPTQRPAADTTF